AEMGGNAWIGLGSVLLVIDTVYNPTHFALPIQISKQALEPTAILLRLDLLSVCLAYGVCQVGKHQASLHEVKAAIEFHLVKCEYTLGQTRAMKHVMVELALIRKVMDCKHARGICPRWISDIEQLQIDGREARLPVVAVNDVRLPSWAKFGNG